MSDQDVDLARVAADLGFPVADFRFRKLDKAPEQRTGGALWRPELWRRSAGVLRPVVQTAGLLGSDPGARGRTGRAFYSHVVRMRLDNKGYGAIFPLTVVQKPHVVYARYRCCEGLGLLHQDLFANDRPISSVHRAPCLWTTRAR